MSKTKKAKAVESDDLRSGWAVVTPHDTISADEDGRYRVFRERHQAETMRAWMKEAGFECRVADIPLVVSGA